jgi:hypothetical protein
MAIPQLTYKPDYLIVVSSLGLDWRALMNVRGSFINLITLASLITLLASASASGQDIEPRLYSNAPVGMNFFVASFSNASGILSTNPDEPLQNAKLSVQTPVFAYARILDVWGKSAKFDVVLPMARFSGSADVYGMRVTRNVSGFSDPAFRFSVNLIGAPALSLQEFRSYQQDLIVGASVQVSAPLGQYDPSKLVNLGANRWKIRPEIGASKAIGPVIFELAQGVFIFTTNDNFFGGRKLEQDAVYTTRANVIYNFGSGASAALHALYFTGGRTTVDGVRKDDLMQTLRVGATLTLEIDRYNSIKLFGSKSITVRTGSDYDILGVAWQYRWGAGL